MAKPRSTVNVVGTEIVYECDAGPVSNVRLNCNSDGSWSDVVPTCAKGNFCIYVYSTFIALIYTSVTAIDTKHTGKSYTTQCIFSLCGEILVDILFFCYVKTIFY